MKILELIFTINSGYIGVYVSGDMMAVQNTCLEQSCPDNGMQYTGRCLVQHCSCASERYHLSTTLLSNNTKRYKSK